MVNVQKMNQFYEGFFNKKYIMRWGYEK